MRELEAMSLFVLGYLTIGIGLIGICGGIYYGTFYENSVGWRSTILLLMGAIILALTKIWEVLNRLKR